MDPNSSSSVSLSRNVDNSKMYVINMQMVTYICGWCGKDNQFRAVDDLICLNCGYRIFYKKKLAEGVQFEAR